MRPALSALLSLALVLVLRGQGDTLSDGLLRWVREAGTSGAGDWMRFFIFLMKCIMKMDFKKEF